MALALVIQGAPQTLTQHVDATTIEGVKQTLVMGPIASQEAIKQIGTNGRGFFNANSSHPYETPTSEVCRSSRILRRDKNKRAAWQAAYQPSTLRRPQIH